MKKNPIQAWYNPVIDLPEPLPPLMDPSEGPSRIHLGKIIRPEILSQQDQYKKRWYPIPKDLLNIYAMIGRPTPLVRLRRLEDYLQTRCHIYMKREDILPTGSFKLNTAVAQVYYAKEEGFEGVVSETGAGQWGMATTLAAKMFGLQSRVYMARASYHQKEYRRIYMRVLGGEVFPSPSDKTEYGRKLLSSHPDHIGSIGIAMGEAVETASKINRLAYVCGSCLPSVMMHQTVIGLETQKQLKLYGEKPDFLIACVGGGSNFGGFMLPFLRQRLESEGLQFLAVESTSVPRLTKGEFRYDFSDGSGLTPLVKSYTLGSDFVPPPIHIGGLRQHNGSSIVGVLRQRGFIDAVAYPQEKVFEAAQTFLRLEGILPAPESAHAVLGTMEKAREYKDEEKVIVFCLSGNGFLDLGSYEAILLKGFGDEKNKQLFLTPADNGPEITTGGGGLYEDNETYFAAQ